MLAFHLMWCHHTQSRGVNNSVAARSWREREENFLAERRALWQAGFCFEVRGQRERCRRGRWKTICLRKRLKERWEELRDEREWGREGWKRVGKKKREEIRGRAAQSNPSFFFVCFRLVRTSVCQTHSVGVAGLDSRRHTKPTEVRRSARRWRLMKKCGVRSPSPFPGHRRILSLPLNLLFTPHPPLYSYPFLAPLPSLRPVYLFLLSDSVSSAAPECNSIRFISAVSCFPFVGVRRGGSGVPECDRKQSGPWNRSVPSSAAWEKNIHTRKELSQETGCHKLKDTW